MKDKISMVVFILILGSVLTTALVAVDYYTKDRIDANKKFKLRKGVLDALSIPYTKDSVEGEFGENGSVRTMEIPHIDENGETKDKSFYISRQDGNIAFQIEGSGLWGDIEGVLALSPDLKTIKGLTVTSQIETPGLGGRIEEKDFLDRFRGKKLSPKLVITKPGKAEAENEVDGITSATLTGKAFEKVINSQAKEYISLYEKGSQ